MARKPKKSKSDVSTSDVGTNDVEVQEAVEQAVSAAVVEAVANDRVVTSEVQPDLFGMNARSVQLDLERKRIRKLAAEAAEKAAAEALKKLGM